jgi:hypothetical protein
VVSFSQAQKFSVLKGCVGVKFDVARWGNETNAEGLRVGLCGPEGDVGNLRKLDCEGGEIKDEMGGECSTHGTEETFKKSFNLKAEGKKV